MAIPLKYNTASQEIPLGQFLDSTNGDSEEPSLTIANTDIKLWKNGATTLANKNSGGATYISNGVYYCVLDATDTNTYGPMVIFVHVTGALAVRVECVVMEANAYDALYAALGTGSVESNLVQMGASTQSATDLKDFADAGYDPATNKVQGVVLTDTVTTYTGNTPQTGDAYAVVNHVTYGNAQLVRSTTPANTLDVNATGEAGIDLDNTSGTLAKTTDITGFNDIAATDIVSAGAITTLTGAVVNVDTVDTCTTNSDMRGTDDAALASVCTETRLSELDEATAGKMANQVDIIQTDTTTDIPATITTLQADTDDIQTRLPAALVSGKMDSDVQAINSSTTAAVQLALSANEIESGQCEGTPSTTVIQTDLAETQDDIYIGRVVIFTSGNARGEATDITDYTGATGTLTVTALANAPAATDTFILI